MRNVKNTIFLLGLGFFTFTSTFIFAEDIFNDPENYFNMPSCGVEMNPRVGPVCTDLGCTSHDDYGNAWYCVYDNSLRAPLIGCTCKKGKTTDFYPDITGESIR